MKPKEGIHEYDVLIDNIRIRYLMDHKIESKDLIVFIHGLACTKETFINVIGSRYFASSSLLLIDLVGFGASMKPEDFSYSMEEQARLCATLINRLPQKELHIVAHSMGGAVVLLFSRNFLESAKSLAIVEGNLIEDDCGMFSRNVASATFQEYRTVMFEEQKNRWAADKLLRFEKTTPLAVYKSALSLVEWSDSGELLRKFRDFKNRKCYFWGEENCDMPVLNRLDFVEKFMISSSGHAMMIDNPEEFYSKLKKFIYHI